MRTTRNIPGLMTDFPTTINRLFADEFLRPAFSNSHSRPALNIVESEDSYGIELAAPGLQKQDFNIHVENNKLLISVLFTFFYFKNFAKKVSKKLGSEQKNAYLYIR